MELEVKIMQKDRFLYLARKYNLKWQQINKAHKKLQAKAGTLSPVSRFGTNPRLFSPQGIISGRNIPEISPY